jgi:hypothetical protein
LALMWSVLAFPKGSLWWSLGVLLDYHTSETSSFHELPQGACAKTAQHKQGDKVYSSKVKGVLACWGGVLLGSRYSDRAFLPFFSEPTFSSSPHPAALPSFHANIQRCNNPSHHPLCTLPYRALQNLLRGLLHLCMEPVNMPRS